MAINMNELIPVTSNTVNSAFTGVTLAGDFLTLNTLIPNNATQSTLQFDTLADVGEFFGINSAEYNAAIYYFNSYLNTPSYPAFCLFSLYINSTLSAYIRNLDPIVATLTSFQAVTSGTITFNINGTAYPVSSIDLHTATSYSQVASLITADFLAAYSGTFPSAVMTYNGVNNSFTFSTGLATGTDTITYCSAGSLAALLQFQATDFAILSQGSLALTPAQNLANVVAITRNWASFTHIWDISGDNTFALDLAFSQFANDSGTNYCYVQYNPVSVAMEESFSDALAIPNYANVIMNYGDITTASFVMGMNASVNYNRVNSTISDAYKQQTGLIPFVTNDADAEALIAAGINFYGKYATKAQIFDFYQQGVITGQWKFIDNFFNQVWLSDQIQVQLAVMFAETGKLPNNDTGYGQLSSTLKTVMTAAINNGVAQIGNTFDAAQVAILIAQAGYDIAPRLTSAGYVIQIIPATPAQRAARQAPITNIWYTNGGSILVLPVNTTYVF